MNAVVVAVGLAGLIALSIAVGAGIARGEAEKERERLRAVEWDLWLREHEIVSAAELGGCPCCALLRARADLQSPPPQV
ncbi:hypothetical protein GCM10009836_59470 [Pseudonocardia ailaonensis]|uniref:Uncharacterized protein n=1 Tax=Pseudonocardia ailaonensis TaxID=367279 RepID=A0ABN2NIM3_9PSEU